MNKIFKDWRGGLIVSCQAPANSPLAKPEIIAALAETAEQNGAVGVRIDSPAHIAAVKQRVKVPVLGIYKIVEASSDVYITPTFASAKVVAAAGADVIAVDATLRRRPNGENLNELVRRIKEELKVPVMADVATLEEGINAIETLGVDCVSTTLSGYTEETKHLVKPDFELLENLARRFDLPIICEGRLRSTEDVQRAFACGAHAVVVGGAITGIDQLVRRFVSVTPARSANVQAS
ncbi:MAG: N-acetylmannosamine-6-phosphate 2-epimerase [Acidobacteria bacterium]|jgi:N-acylglucosamine-6-phosphate 2-epimerase|nr:N-acetylmannosamine-6-phosphate 2-epimerase [Acidobacteriota bacterium]